MIYIRILNLKNVDISELDPPTPQKKKDFLLKKYKC